MEIFENVIIVAIYAWLIPSILLTWHTLYTLVHIACVPIRSKVPSIIGIGYLLFIYGPFEMKLHTRPRWQDALIILIAGLVPVVSLAILIAYVFCMYIVISCGKDKILNKINNG
jgi:hypothetical protein